MNITELIKIILLLYLVFFLFSTIFLSYRVYKQTGVFPVIKNITSVYGFVDRIVLTSYVLLIINVLVYIFKNSEPHYFLDCISLKIIGFILITIALFSMFTAQLQMGKQWRIGIDDKNEIEIIKSGFFKYMRHPIYFFALLIALGTVLIIPTIVTLAIFILLWVALSIQSRLEEEFMLKKFGEKYQPFLQKKRWF